jgi:phosphoglycerate dehydrogenase-like enzyme
VYGGVRRTAPELRGFPDTPARPSICLGRSVLKRTDMHTGRAGNVHIAVLDDYQGIALEMADWSILGPGVAVTVFRDRLVSEDMLVSNLAGYEIVAAMRERTPFPRSVFDRLPDLRLLVTTGPRNRSIDLAAAAEHGVLVCSTEGLYEPTAELTWALLLALTRNIPTEVDNLRNGRWQTTIGTIVHGKTLGIVGLGTIGTQVARVAQAFGMTVIAWSQNLTDERAMQVGATRVDKAELFRMADIVTVHLVLSERTLGLVGRRELALLKPSAYLINTSRGPIVDQEALADMLERGEIAGAALDVFDIEPLPLDHRLRRLPRAILTPHIGYVTHEEYRLFYSQIVEDIAAYLSGQPIRVLRRSR